MAFMKTGAPEKAGASIALEDGTPAKVETVEREEHEDGREDEAEEDFG